MRVQRLVVVGGSTRAVCGVRDYASTTANAFGRAGVQVEIVWWTRDTEWSISEARRDLRRWLRDVADAVDRTRPDVIVWEYAPLTYGWRGIGLLQRQVARSLARHGVPLVVVLHELAHPFRARGWRGPLLAVTQRAALLTVISNSAAYVVTTDRRLRWSKSRWWLPRRPATMLPVCSSLPTADPPAEHEGIQVGIFGFGYEFARAEVAVTAFAELHRRRRDAQLALIGHANEMAVSRWTTLARNAGCRDAVRITGRLEAHELAAELAACDLALVVDAGGPSTKRSTLAAMIAASVPVLALDGADTWAPLREEHAVELAAATNLPDALCGLAGDRERRRELAARARVLYERAMAPAAVVKGTAALAERAREAR